MADPRKRHQQASREQHERDDNNFHVQAIPAVGGENLWNQEAGPWVLPVTAVKQALILE